MRKHDIDISSLSDILLIFNIANIDIDIDIYCGEYFATYFVSFCDIVMIRDASFRIAFWFDFAGQMV